MNSSVHKIIVTGAAALALSIGAAPAGAGPLLITQNSDASQLVAALVSGASGISVVAGSETYIGDPIASGTFTGGTGIIPFDSGVILTSGNVNLADGSPAGTNSSDGAGATNTGGSDAQLDALNGASDIEDAAILQFQFTATDPFISFQYAFASEEYNEFVGSAFNDVFGFFLNGTNIALIPGTSTPVAINNVNCVTNAQYYTNNDSGGSTGGDAACAAAGKPVANLGFEYDGIAGASPNPLFWLFASGNVLTGGAINTIKLAIGDSSDTVLDSAVFLKAGSFVNQPPPSTAPEPGLLGLLGFGLVGAARRYRRRNA